MYAQIRIINTKTKLEKIIDIDKFNCTDLNIICKFYEDHKDYIIERI